MKELLSFLVVDDAEMVRNMVQDLLVDMGHFDVTMAPDGQAAIDLIRQRKAAGGGFHFLITDWEMPGLNGLQLVQEAKTALNLRRTGLLMVTSGADAERVRAAAEVGIDGYILKPFTPEIFQTKVRQVIARKFPHHT